MGRCDFIMISWLLMEDVIKITKDDDETLKGIDHGFLKVAKEVSRDRFGLLPNYINYILMIMMT